MRHAAGPIGLTAQVVESLDPFFPSPLDGFGFASALGADSFAGAFGGTDAVSAPRESVR
jgi:hypothetical protein